MTLITVFQLIMFVVCVLHSRDTTLETPPHISGAVADAREEPATVRRAPALSLDALTEHRAVGAHLVEAAVPLEAAHPLEPAVPLEPAHLLGPDLVPASL